MDAKCLKDLDFPNAVKTVYRTTVESDKGLRNLVVALTYAFIRTFTKKKAFLSMMAEVGEFSKDLTLGIISLGDADMRWLCKHCEREVEMDLPIAAKDAYCPSCGKGSRKSAWFGKAKSHWTGVAEYDCPNCRSIVWMDLETDLQPSGDPPQTFAPCCGVPQANEKWQRSKIEVNYSDEDEAPSREPSSTSDEDQV
ncbi:uncharacterized protein J3D65DRAFT_355229 [Phyllosticta citribraziliensis]|uniref:Uncharacterized protein n=1 Tax=Phyllosticta citribraziliensis TaxID=989973 RepID=A0ABR1LNT4_9PEZI